MKVAVRIALPATCVLAACSANTGDLAEPCSVASSHQLHVPGDFPTIQGAIDAAPPSHTVRVAPGRYTESVRLRPDVCLLGSGADNTILDAGGEGHALVDLTDAPGSVVAGFTIRGVEQKPDASTFDPFEGTGVYHPAGVYAGYTGTWAHESPLVDAPALIANNIFESNHVGVMLYFGGIATVRNNIFVGNRNGLVANHFADGHALIANNTFVGNRELAIGNQAAYLEIVDNIIVGSDVGVRFEFIQTGRSACNVFWDNRLVEHDNRYPDYPRFEIGSDGNVEADPLFAGGGDYHVPPGSPAKDAGCLEAKVDDADGTPPDIGAFGGAYGTWTVF